MAEERTKKEEVETSGKNLEMEFNKDEKLMVDNVDEIEPKEPTDQEKLEIKERAAAQKAIKDAEVAAAAN